MIKNAVEGTLDAFRAAKVQELAVGADWESKDAEPMRDIRRAKRMISSAKAPDRKDALMGYKPDIIVMNDATLDAALFHESVQKFYTGSAAVNNPIYLGITPNVIGGLRVVTSQFIPEGDVYIMQSGVAGFVSDADALTVTSMYSEFGENGFGGANQSWRVDAFRNRIIAVDNPLAVVKLIGVEP